mmetsp:Transcript_22232/g.36833  ORF Transcript_22232/g.36833 Transcript_22232/m.36833 type:complete len:154 (+) Transcript_22232:193-654(+)
MGLDTRLGNGYVQALICIHPCSQKMLCKSSVNAILRGRLQAVNHTSRRVLKRKVRIYLMRTVGAIRSAEYWSDGFSFGPGSNVDYNTMTKLTAVFPSPFLAALDCVRQALRPDIRGLIYEIGIILEIVLRNCRHCTFLRDKKGGATSYDRLYR